MKKIRIGNDIVIKWRITVNGEEVNLEGLDLSLYISTTYQPRKQIAFTVAGNEITATFKGVEQKVTGVYRLTLYRNEGENAQSILDACDAFELVSCSCLTVDAAFGGAEVELPIADLGVGIPGLSAYEIAVSEGFVGTQAEWIASLSAASEAAAAECREVIAEFSQAEDSRVTAEAQRVANENNRIAGEGSRVEAENDRVAAEQLRATAESKRDTAEGARSSAEGIRVSNENIRLAAEETRSQNEAARVTAESKRAEAEAARAKAEAARAEEFAGFTATLAAKEDAANKVTTIGAGATDERYPSAKAVKDAIQAETTRATIAEQSNAQAIATKLNKTELPIKNVEEPGIYFVDEKGNAFMIYSNEKGLEVSKISQEMADKVLAFLAIKQELGDSSTSVISQKAVTDAIADVKNNIKIVSEVVEDGAFLCNEKGEVFARFVNGKFEAVGMELTEQLDIDITNVVPVVEGYTTELYNEQLIDVPNVNNYYFKYTCSKGKQYERKWSIDAVSGDAGDYSLKIEVFNLKNELVGSKTTILRILSKIEGLSENDVQVVAVGDSWHSPGIQTRTLVDDFSKLYNGVYVCKSIGTQTNNQNSDGRNYTEGRSGWRSDQYISQGWASQFIITVSGISVIPERKKKYRLTSQYTHFFFGLEVEETNLSLSSDGSTYEGTILFNYYGVGGGQNYEISVTPIIITAYNGSDYGENTGGMAGDTEIRGSKATVPSSTGNPFWNSEKRELDFNNYCKIHNLKPTIFYIALGTNQSNDDVNIPAFITAMRNTSYDEIVGVNWATIPVIIAQQQHWGNIRWDVSRKQYIFNKHKLMTDAINIISDEQVYLMPFAQCFDSRYNFGAKEVGISPRNTSYSEKIPTDYVHCDGNGYKRCGDLIFFFVMNVLYNNLNK